MSEFLGRRQILNVDTSSVGGAAAVWVKFLQRRSSSVGMAAETADSTHADSGGWAKAIITRNSWTLSIEVVLDRQDPAWQFIYQEFKAQRMVYIQVDDSQIGGIKEEGQAIINGVPREAPEADVVTGTLEFTGNGAFTPSP